MKGYSDEAVRVPSLGSEDAEYLDKAVTVPVGWVWKILLADLALPQEILLC